MSTGMEVVCILFMSVMIPSLWPIATRLKEIRDTLQAILKEMNEI